MKSIHKFLPAFFVLVALTGAGVLISYSLKSLNRPPEFATVWPFPKELPDFTLIDERGGEFTVSSLRGRWSLIFFGFTHCPDICPATLQQLALANGQLEAAGQDKPEIILVSVDPERDTPETLRAYTGHFGADIRGVTGDLAELMKLTSAAGIFFQKSALPDGNYTVDHSTVVLVINENGEIHASFGAPHSIDAFVRDLPILMSTS